MKINSKIIRVKISPDTKLKAHIDRFNDCFRKNPHLVAIPGQQKFNGDTKVRQIELNGEKALSLSALTNKIQKLGLEPATLEVLMSCEGQNDHGDVFICTGTMLKSKNRGEYLPILGWDEGINVDDQVISLIDMNCVWDTRKLKWIKGRVKFGYKAKCPFSFPYREAVRGRGLFLAVEK